MSNYVVAIAAAAAAAAGTVVVGGVKIYTHFFSKRPAASQPEPIDLGAFAVWGQPDAGKTTFIARLRGKVCNSEKEQTTSMISYGKFELEGVNGGPYVVRELIDMPGSKDRLGDWLAQVESKKQVFYIISLERLSDENYRRKVKFDVGKTVEKLKECGGKKIKIIGTHLDKSEWKSISTAKVNNEIHDHPYMREVQEQFGIFSGYMYSVNLMDDISSSRLLQDIVNDCKK